MGELVVSIGTGRQSKKWKQHYLSWEEFVKKASEWDVKRYTVEEFHKMKAKHKKTKSQKLGTEIADIKDTMSYVGGAIKGDRRTKQAVESRSMLTLDADNIDNYEEFMDNVSRVLSDNYYLIHSTLSHTPDNVRLRLILPLSEEVGAEKHEAVARKIAEEIGLDYFDASTFDVNRLLYFPSKLMDAEVVWEENDIFGYVPLDVDDVLSRYFDWKNTHEWARHAHIELRNEMHRAKDDPLEKLGQIGVFNRTYSITEAIDTFLSNVYVPTDVEDRYTFVEGSTAGGLVIYDGDVFCHSHHSTDPIHGQMVNAYDLVRLHKYDHLDADTGGAIAVGKRPSDKAMNAFVDRDKQCIRTMLAEKEKDFADDFGDEEYDMAQSSDNTTTDEVDPDAWKDKLAMADGEIDTTTHNFTLLINNGRLRDTFAYNEFTGGYDILKHVPWRKEEEWHMGHAVQFVDRDEKQLRVWIERKYNLRRKDMLEDAITEVVHTNSYHPIKDKIESVVWDGVPRAETILVDTLNAEDSKYVRQVTRKTLLAAVTRLYRPGTKFDYMPVLVGPQGNGKSSLLKKLAMSDEWFNDSLDDLSDTKKAGEQLQAGWIFELGELSAMGKSGVEDVKRFITSTNDKYRASYDKSVTPHPRKNIFFGTTNRIDFLIDKTGNRRFMPITVSRMPEGKEHWNTLPTDRKGDAGFEYISQLWAEVLTWFKAGESVFLDQEIAMIAEKIQKDHTLVDDLEESILSWLEEPEEADEFDIGEPVIRTRVTIRDIYKQVLNGSETVVPRQASNQIKAVMNNLRGWEHKKSIRGKDGKTSTGYVRV